MKRSHPKSPQMPFLVLFAGILLIPLVASFVFLTKQNQEQPTVLASTTTAGVKEHFIPIAGGLNAASDWTDVSGASVTLDSANYGSIKKVTFEASIYCPTGNQQVYVRLYNVTDAHPVWSSELSMSGSGPTLLTSPSVSLGSGSKTYIVQMKSQLRYPAELKMARLHIITN